MSEHVTTFFDAVKRGDTEHVKTLVKGNADLLTARTGQGVSGVSLAMYHGCHDIVELLIEHGAPLDIHDASVAGRGDRVEQLLKEDPSRVNLVSADGFFPLSLAAFFGHRGLVDLLLAQGADVNAHARNPMRVAALHAATARRDPRIMKALLDHGADVNAAQQAGFRPLHASAQSGDKESAELLVARGAETNATNEAGKTPADVAREHGHAELAEWLDSLNLSTYVGPTFRLR